MAEEMFWLDKWEGEAKGDYYVRSNLFEFFKKCEKNGLKVVAIKKPTDWNLCVVCERINDTNQENHENQEIHQTKQTVQTESGDILSGNLKRSGGSTEVKTGDNIQDAPVSGDENNGN